MASLFTVQTPALPNQSDGTPGISTATTMQFAVAGSVTGIRFYATSTVGGTYTAELWLCTGADDVTPGGTLLKTASVGSGSITPGTWNDIPFASSQAISTTQLYRCVIHNTDGRYVATSGFFFAAGLTNGDITAYQSGTDPNPPGLGGMRNGSFTINAAAGNYPSSSSNSTCYFVDVLFTADSTIDGTAAAPLGALSGAATGEVDVPGTAAGALGGLGATASGSVAVSGSAAASLGSLTARAVEEEPIIDVLLEPLMDQILACLCEAAARIPNPPQHCCFRVGEVAHDAGLNQDLCCEGLAYVTLGDIYPSSTSFPEQDIIRQAAASCAPPTWAVAVKMGIIRCVPVGDLYNPVSCTEWNTAAKQTIYDSFALRNAACCVRNYITAGTDAFLGMSVIIERQTQGNPGGGCVERSINMTIQIPNCSC